MMESSIRITADEINCLIYSYFQDSGFTHSAFAIRNESSLERSPHFTKHIPRGELVDLLCKSLLYLEVESHWRGDALTTNCKTGFSLLEPHICSLEPPTAKKATFPALSIVTDNNSVSNPKPNGTTAIEPNVKRKTSPIIADGPTEKRARRDPDDMEIDSSSESSKPRVSSGGQQDAPRNPSPDLTSKKHTKSKPRSQGSGNEYTDPRAILLLPGHKTEVFVCAFNPVKHDLLATGSKDAIVNLWSLPDPPGGKGNFSQPPGPPLVLDHFAKAEQGDLTSLHWNADGSLLAIGSYDSVLRICTSTGELYFSHPQHQGPIFATRFSKSGHWLLTASLDGTACLWDVKDKRLHRQYRCHTDCCLDVDWLDENTFATCGADQLIYILRVDENDPIKTLAGHQNEINQIKCDPSGTRLASCSDDTTARIWRVDNLSSSADAIPGLVTSDHAVVLEGHKHSVSTIGWCPDQSLGPTHHRLIATSSFDGTARLWDSVTSACLRIFTDHKRPVYALTFSPDGQWLATGSGDGWLYIYNVLGKDKRWSWYAGAEKPGVFEIDWQVHNDINRIALALECRRVAVIDVPKVISLNDVVRPSSGTLALQIARAGGS